MKYWKYINPFCKFLGITFFILGVGGSGCHEPTPLFLDLSEVPLKVVYGEKINAADPELIGRYRPNWLAQPGVTHFIHPPEFVETDDLSAGIRFVEAMREELLLAQDGGLFLFLPKGVELPKNFDQKKKKILSRVPSNFDVIYLDAGDERCRFSPLPETEYLKGPGEEACGAKNNLAIINGKSIRKITALLHVFYQSPQAQLAKYFGLIVRAFWSNQPISDPGEPQKNSELSWGPQDDLNRGPMAGPINLAADVDIRFINLDSGRTSDERRAKITGMLDGAGLQYRKFNAVDGRRGDFKIGDYGDYLTTWWLPALPFHPIHTDIVMIDLLKYDFDDKFHDVKYSCYFESPKNRAGCISRYIGNGTAATALSHVRLLEEHLEKNTSNPEEAKHVLIFEDDAEVPGDLKTLFAERTQELPADWDILYLHHIDKKCVARKKAENIWQYKVNETCMPGGFAYMVNKDSLDKMVKIMKPLHEESDRHLMRYFGKILKAYWVYPSLVGVTLSGESTRRAADDT